MDVFNCIRPVDKSGACDCKTYRGALQKIDGFGACFNELGWEALLSLPEAVRTKILTELFTKEGVNFSFCRMPVASNDYSLSYYSYNDVPEDFEMKNFNIDRDRYILIPYIKAAKRSDPI